jgi:hypothetical protein
LTIDSWEEDTFEIAVRVPDSPVGNPDFDWDSIEAVGAADDASRFRIDSPDEDLTGSRP